MDSRSAAEGIDLDPRILADDPRISGRDSATEERLPARVRVVRRAVLGGIALGVSVEQLQRPPGKRGPQLLELVRVTRAEDEP